MPEHPAAVTGFYGDKYWVSGFTLIFSWWYNLGTGDLCSFSPLLYTALYIYIYIIFRLFKAISLDFSKQFPTSTWSSQLMPTFREGRNHHTRFTSWDKRHKDASRFCESPMGNWGNSRVRSHVFSGSVPSSSPPCLDSTTHPHLGGGNAYPQDWSSLSISNVVLILDAKWASQQYRPEARWLHSDANTLCSLEIKAPQMLPNAFLLVPRAYLENREHTLLQALVLLWKWKSLSHVWLFVTPWTIQSMEFSRSEYWSG